MREKLNEIELHNDRILLEESIKEFIQDRMHVFSPEANTITTKSGHLSVPENNPLLEAELKNKIFSLLKKIKTIELNHLSDNLITECIADKLSNKYANLNVTALSEFLRLLKLYTQLLSLYKTS